MFYRLLFVLLSTLSFLSYTQDIVLTGSELTIDQVHQITLPSTRIVVDPAAWERVRRSHTLLLQAAKEDQPIYGLNRGVGLNKDKKIFDGDTLNPEAREASETFNKNMLYSHSAAVAPELSKKIVFSMMLIRLNMMLKGHTGISPEVVEMFVQFLNHRIAPIIPAQGSVGEGDITILSHIGLAMMGEGDVLYNDKRMPAREALKQCNLQPIKPFAKDSLSILSSNAYSVAMGALIIHDLRNWLQKSIVILGLSLEGLDGNIAPFLTEVQKLRPFKGQMKVAKEILAALQGSSLFEKSSTRSLQDPLSYRTISQLYGAVADITNRLAQKLTLHMNSSDDNPGVILDINPNATATNQEQTYYVSTQGAVIPTANFEPIDLVVDFEALAIALSHASHSTAQRLMRLSDERFTHLSRFLSPNPQTIAFGTIQKTFMALDTEIKSLSLPVSADFFPVAGEIEDVATNSPLVLHRLCKIMTNLHYLSGIELMYAVQAVELRQRSTPTFTLGTMTGKLYAAYREKISFLEKDRPLTPDIKTSYDFVGLMCYFLMNNAFKTID